MKDKRRDPRFDSNQKLWCEGQELKITAQAKNMSRGGMAIVTDQAPQLGSHLKVSFVTEEEGDVSMDMEVVWRDDKPQNDGQVALGLRMVKFEKGRDAFDRFVSRHLDNDAPVEQEADQVIADDEKNEDEKNESE